MEPETVVTVLDRIGIFAFAFAGAQAGIRRRLDVFGVLVLGLVTATGGGVIRDVMLQRDASLQWAARSSGRWFPRDSGSSTSSSG